MRVAVASGCCSFPFALLHGHGFFGFRFVTSPPRSRPAASFLNQVRLGCGGGAEPIRTFREWSVSSSSRVRLARWSTHLFIPMRSNEGKDLYWFAFDNAY